MVKRLTDHRLRRAKQAVAAVLLAGAFALFHEVVHVTVAMHLDNLGTCPSTGLSIKPHGAGMRTCLQTPPAPANAIAGPYATALLSFVLFVGYQRVPRNWMRAPTFAIGAAQTVQESLYGMGVFNSPRLTQSGVNYWGDGVVALEAYGMGAMVPGLALIVATAIVLLTRLQIRGDKSNNVPTRL